MSDSDVTWFGRGSDVVRMWFGAVRGQNLIFCDVVRTRFGRGSDVVREGFWSIFAHFGPKPSFFWCFGQTKPTCADFDCFRKQICNFWANLRIATVLVENLKGFMNMACMFCTQLFYQQFRCNPKFLLIFILQQFGTHRTGLLIGPESDSMHSHLL